MGCTSRQGRWAVTADVMMRREIVVRRERGEGVKNARHREVKTIKGEFIVHSRVQNGSFGAEEGESVVVTISGSSWHNTRPLGTSKFHGCTTREVENMTER
ncbi:unnamed protein product [Pleuronectes platessa]|uniref:Uncharacterized protein n=1 Tax=Pleuronectes platessa TaxID=8262 RepID=A0A9N7U3V6_PLEPL|nr:unnamed protein product [Pleuronectes platessa]